VAGHRDPRSTLIALVAGVMLFVTAAIALTMLSVPNAPLVAGAAAILVTTIAVWRARSGGTP
jgi:Flp pilus assembly protein TadB